MQNKLVLRKPHVGLAQVRPLRSLAAIALGIGLGFLLTMQVQTALVRPPATTDYGREVSAATIQRLESEQKSLKDSIAALRSRLYALQAAGSSAASLLALTEDLDRQRMAAGLTTVRGPGVGVTLDDSTRPLPAGDDPANYLIHDYEVRDVVSLLWLSGAEAVAINDERLVAQTSIYCVGSTIIVNNTRLSPPYEIRAIGNSAQLDSALQDPGNLRKLKSRTRLYGIQLRPTRAAEILLPAYSGDLAVKHANPATR